MENMIKIQEYRKQMKEMHNDVMSVLTGEESRNKILQRYHDFMIEINTLSLSNNSHDIKEAMSKIDSFQTFLSRYSGKSEMMQYNVRLNALRQKLMAKYFILRERETDNFQKTKRMK